MKKLDTQSPDFQAELKALLALKPRKILKSTVLLPISAPMFKNAAMRR